MEKIMLGPNNYQPDVIEIEANTIDLEKLNNLPQISFQSIKESLKNKYFFLK